jgi:hypothetical protein
MMISRLVCATVLIAAFTPSLAQQQVPGSPDQPARVYDYIFPVEFDGAKRLSVRGYDNPGLGYSVGYQKGPIIMTIYIYDLGRKDIPDDPDTDVVIDELRDSVKEAMQVRKNAEVKKAFSLPDAQKVTRLNCVWLTYEGNVDGTVEGNVDGTVCLGTAKSRFIKFRTSAPETPRSLGYSIFFVRSWLPFFWPSS